MESSACAAQGNFGYEVNAKLAILMVTMMVRTVFVIGVSMLEHKNVRNVMRHVGSVQGLVPITVSNAHKQV